MNLGDIGERTDFSTLIAPGKTLAQAIEHHHHTITNVTIGPSLDRLVECYRDLRKKSPTTLSAVSEASEDEVKEFFAKYFANDYKKVVLVKTDIYKDDKLV